MKALQIFNAVALALTATLFGSFAVVCLMYAVHLDATPRMRTEWPLVWQVTAVFAVLSLFSFLAFWSQRRAMAWRWPAQIALPLVLGMGALILRRMLID